MLNRANTAVNLALRAKLACFYLYGN